MSKSRRKEEFIASFRERMAVAGGDAEIEHSAADNLLLEALRAAGWGEVADLWEEWNSKVGFWYA